jgi:nitroimidazol reductase NimA-like FMN-containing flavoprotein (pyridoxamine 5'-phosphate oxidase superfamily)
MAHEGEPVLSDIPCNSGYYFSSVIGYGETFFIDPIEEKCEALSIMFKHQFGKEVTFTDKQAESVCIFKISSTDFKGKRKPKPE